MGIFNLDEKPGIFNGAKKINKAIARGMLLLMNHYRYSKELKVEVTALNDSTASLLVLEELSPNIARGDYVVLKTTDDEFFLTGTVKSITGRYPFEFLLEINKIETMSNVKKNHKFDTSIQASLKVFGIGDNIPAIVKRISMDAIKASCKENIPMDEMVITTVMIDNKTRIVFRCKVVRKDKSEDFTDYGLEITDFSEENKRNWYRFISGLEQ